MKTQRWATLGLVCGLMLAACGGPATETPAAGPVMTSTSSAATATALPPTPTALPPTALPPITVTPGGPLVLTPAGQLGRGQAFQMAWSPDGARLAVGSSVGVYVLDAATLEVMQLLPTDGPVYLVRYSPDGRALVGGGVRADAAGGGGVGAAWVWDAADGALPPTELGQGHTLPVGFWLNDLAVDKSGSLLAVGGLFPTTQAQVWDINNEAPLFTASPEGAGATVGASVAFSPDGQLLALAGGAPGVTLYQPRTGELLGVLPGLDGPTYDLAFSPDGRWLAAGSDQQVGLWDVATRTLARRVPAEGAVWHVAFGADGQHLALASGTAVQMIDTATGDFVGGLRTDGPVVSIAISAGPASEVLRAADLGQTYTWDQTSSSSQPLRGFTGPVQGLAFMPNGRILSSEYETLRVWDVAAGASVRAWAVAAQGRPALSPNGRQVASGYCTTKDALSGACQDHLVGVWDMATGNLLRSLTAHTGAVNAVAYSAPTGLGQADGRWLASAGADGLVAVWDAANGSQVYTLTLHSGPVAAVAFTPDSRTLASAGYDGQVILWDVDSGTPRTQLTVGDGSPVYALAFNAAGTLLATGSAAPDSTVRVWRIAAPTELGQAGAADVNPLAELTGHTGDIRALAFDPSGQWLVSGGASTPTGAQDNTVRVWAITDTGGACKESLTPEIGAVFALAFSADGRVLVAGGSKGVVARWVIGATP